MAKASKKLEVRLLIILTSHPSVVTGSSFGVSTPYAFWLTPSQKLKASEATAPAAPPCLVAHGTAAPSRNRPRIGDPHALSRISLN